MPRSPHTGNTARPKAAVHMGTYTSSPKCILFHSHEHTSGTEKQFHPSMGSVTPQIEVHMCSEEGRTVRRVLAGGGPAGGSLKILDEGAQENRTTPQALKKCKTLVLTQSTGSKH